MNRRDKSSDKKYKSFYYQHKKDTSTDRNINPSTKKRFAQVQKKVQDVFQLFLTIFSTKMKNKLQPTRVTFSRNLQYAPRWLSKVFPFCTENGEEQFKNHSV